MSDLPPIRFSDSPFQRFLGIELLSAEPGAVEIRLPFREELRRTDGDDWLHGGVLSALVDIAGAYAVYTRTGGAAPTIDLRIDYLRPALRGDLVASGQAIKIGSRVGVADIEVMDSGGKLICTGRGAYAV